MAFTIDDLAKELNLDLSTLAPEARNKWNGYLSEADNKYRAATQAQQEAEAKLRQLEQENESINEYVAKYGANEQTIASLRANNAAMKAQLETLKGTGFDVTIPDDPKPQQAQQGNGFDPQDFQNRVNQSLILGFDMQNRYQRLYGQPMPDDLSVLVREAQQQRQPLQDYVSRKYDFAGKEKALTEERQKKHDAEIAAAAVRKYQEENPRSASNPDMRRSIQSRFPQVEQRRGDLNEIRKAGRMSARERVTRSVQRSMDALRSQAS